MKLIDNWTTHLWRAWSIRANAIIGLAVIYLAQNPQQVEQLLNMLPDGNTRILASTAIGLLIFASTSGARLARQEGMENP